MTIFLSNRIETRKWWRYGCHREPLFSAQSGDLPNTYKLSEQYLGLPNFLDIGASEYRFYFRKNNQLFKRFYLGVTFMKGIILAGGTGSRLAPITSGISKHLIPLYDKPTIYYPISTLMLAGINEITIICTPKHIESYQELLEDTVKIGLNITFVVQEKPLGIPHALLLANPYAVNQKVALICGDNFFYGRGLSQVLKSNLKLNVEHVFLDIV